MCIRVFRPTTLSHNRVIYSHICIDNLTLYSYANDICFNERPKQNKKPCMHHSLSHLYRPYCTVLPFVIAPKLFIEGIFQENELNLYLEQEQVC